MQHHQHYHVAKALIINGLLPIYHLILLYNLDKLWYRLKCFNIRCITHLRPFHEMHSVVQRSSYDPVYGISYTVKKGCVSENLH